MLISYCVLFVSSARLESVNMSGIICTVCVFLITLIVCYAQNVQVQEKWHRSAFPNPYKDIEKCGRYRKSSICDPNNILKDDEGTQTISFVC